MFKNSKTCVVFEDGISFYNAYIKDAVQKYWKYTNYEFIDQKELATGPPNTLFHFHSGPPKDAGAGKCFEMIFDIEGNLYYHHFWKITNDNPDGFNLKDFNNII